MSSNVNLFLHKKQIQSDGTEAEIIEFFHNQNITIRFADGYIKRRQTMKDFIAGQIEHPGLADNHVPFANHQTSPIFTGPTGTVYYLSKCKKCKQKHILSQTQLLNHHCDEERFIP